MTAQSIVDIPKKTESEPPYCSDPDCEYCKGLREMQEQIIRREANARKDGDNSP